MGIAHNGRSFCAETFFVKEECRPVNVTDQSHELLLSLLLRNLITKFFVSMK